jgi:16S rRNA U1498 N3-methylase RsmE
MAVAQQVEGAGERREQWQRLGKHWRDSLEEANRQSRSSAFLDIETPEELKDALREFRTEGVGYEAERPSSINEKLAPAFTSLLPFAKTIGSASQYEQVSALLWAGLLAVIEV